MGPLTGRPYEGRGGCNEGRPANAARPAGMSTPCRAVPFGNPAGIYCVVPWSELGDGVDYLPCSEALWATAIHHVDGRKRFPKPCVGGSIPPGGTKPLVWF